MQRRVPPGSRRIHGAVLSVSTMGGYSVHRGEEYLGFIHATVGDQWNAYVRRPDELADHLGRFGQEQAVQQIVESWDAAAAAGRAA